MYLQRSDLNSSNRHLPEYRLNKTRVQTQEYGPLMRNILMTRMIKGFFPAPNEFNRSLAIGFYPSSTVL